MKAPSPLLLCIYLDLDLDLDLELLNEGAATAAVRSISTQCEYLTQAVGETRDAPKKLLNGAVLLLGDLAGGGVAASKAVFGVGAHNTITEAMLELGLGDDLELQRNGAAALEKLAFGPSACSGIISGGGLKALTAGMRHNHADLDLQEAGISAFAALLSQGEPLFKEALTLTLTLTLTLSSGEPLFKEAVEAGVHLAALQVTGQPTYIGNTDLQLGGLKVLIAICGSSQGRDAVAREGGLEAGRACMLRDSVEESALDMET